MVYFKTTMNFIEMTSNMIYIVAFGGNMNYPNKNSFEHTVGGGGDY